MSRKAFHIGIDFDVHAVSCPGVWLCPKGDVMLRVSMLEASAHTKRVEPSFPLLFHESFHFRKTLMGVVSLAGLQAELTRRVAQLQLVQWPGHGCRCILLAEFRSPLSDLLYPQSPTRSLITGVDINLLMDTTSCFPGIISPKVEVSTKVVIEEMVNYPSREGMVFSQKTLSSKRTGCKREDKPDSKAKTKSVLSNGYRSRVRQKPVCHTKPSVRCYYCKQRVRRGRGRAVAEGQCSCGGETLPPTRPVTDDDTLYIPYCNRCGDVVEENAVKQGKIILSESAQRTDKWEEACPCIQPQRPKSACDCNLCRRYHNLFKNSTVSPPESALLQDPKSPSGRFDRSPPPKKEKCCPCLNEKSGAGGPKDCITDQVRKVPRDEEYRNIFKADLDSHYKKLYERVSRRNNRRES